MNRYKVTVSLFIDADSESEAEDFATNMMCGTEMMTRIWQVDNAEYQWRHEE